MSDPAIEGKVVLITGASSGIGRHLCSALMNRGARVVAASRSATRAGVDAALAIDMDVGDSESVAIGVARVQEIFGSLDAVINNAGIVENSNLTKMTPDAWESVITTNLSGPYHVVRAAYPLLAKARGAIINLSSIAGVKPMRGLGAYGASKAALLHLTKVMALELARDGIRANAIVPGYIHTPMNDAFLSTKAGEKLVDSIPLRSAGTVMDVENAVVFLVSDASQYVTGSSLTVDGGFLLGQP